MIRFTILPINKGNLPTLEHFYHYLLQFKVPLGYSGSIMTKRQEGKFFITPGKSALQSTFKIRNLKEDMTLNLTHTVVSVGSSLPLKESNNNT